MSPAWLAALALLVTGPPRASFEVTHLPKLALVLVLAAALSFRLRRAPQTFDGIDLLGLAAVLGVAASGAFAVSPAYALTPSLLVVGALTTAFAVRAEVDRRWRWLGWLGLAVGAIALLGLLELAGLWHFFSIRGRTPASVMGQRNTLAHLLVLGSPMIWALACRPSRGRFLWVATAALIGFVVVGTRCRAAYLAGPVSVVVFAAFALRDRSSRLPLLALTGVTLGAVAASGLLPVALDWTSPTPYADSARQLFDASTGSGAGRLAQLRHAWGLFIHRPLFGAGPGNWFVIAGAEGHFVNSDGIGLAVERGAVGVLTTLALLLGVLRRWWRLPWTIDAWPLVAGTATALVGVGALDAVIQLTAGLLLVTLIFSVGLRRGRALGQGSARVLGPVVAALLLVGALGIASRFASRLYSSAEATPFHALERAAVLDPLDGELRLTLADAYVSAGRFEEARPHVAALRRLLPLHPRGLELAAVCGE